MKNKLRPLGKITSDLEPLIEELIDGHKLQWGEVLFLIYGYLMIHYSDAQEQYEDGTNPKFTYK